MNGARRLDAQRWALALLMAAGLWAGTARAADPPPLAAGHTKFLGNVYTGQLDPYFARYWNQVTPENAGKWLSVEATRGTMAWGVLDLAFAQARERGWPVKQHTFVWGQQEPSWVASLPPDEQLAAVDAWMRAFAERYSDVDMIDVVNEPLHAPPSYAEALGGAGETGWDWVIWAFERTRDLFPDATLLINEYNILCCSRNRVLYEDLVALLQERGLIDGIGVQAHGLESVHPAVIAANLDALAMLGLPVYVSELDLETPDDAEQLAMYRRVFPVLWEHEAVAGVTLWGYKAGQIWKRNAYLLDWLDEERPALQWLAAYLRGEAVD